MLQEKQEDARNATLDVLSKWLLLHDDPPKSVFDFFLKGLKGKVKEERWRVALAFAVVSSNSASHQHCAPFIDVLEKMVLEAQKKIVRIGVVDFHPSCGVSTPCVRPLAHHSQPICLHP